VQADLKNIYLNQCDASKYQTYMKDMFNFKYLHYLAIRKKQVFNETLVGADI
jgi:hypothetical protein